MAQRLGRTRSGPWVRAPRSASFNVGPALPDAIHGRQPGLGSTASRICPAMAMPSWPVAASAITWCDCGPWMRRARSRRFALLLLARSLPVVERISGFPGQGRERAAGTVFPRERGLAREGRLRLMSTPRYRDPGMPGTGVTDERDIRAPVVHQVSFRRATYRRSAPFVPIHAELIFDTGRPTRPVWCGYDGDSTGRPAAAAASSSRLS